MSGIFDILAREILDSRGTPTVEVEVVLESGIMGRASVPSGTSFGHPEMVELRDGDMSRFLGKGVLKAVENVEEKIAPHLIGKDVLDQMEIDAALVSLDGTPNKSKLGANAILGVSMACAKAAAEYLDLPLYRYLGGSFSHTLPVPMINILNGEHHTEDPLDIREFMIIPAGAGNVREAIRMGTEIFHHLKALLKKEGDITSVGDEGEFAPDFSSNREALELIIRAIQSAGYHPGREILLAINPSANEGYADGTYIRKAKEKTGRSVEEMVDFYEALLTEFPIVSIEDGLAENDWGGWKTLTDRLGNRVQLVGNDLFDTNPERLRRGIREGAANAITITLSQIGTVSEALRTIEMATRAGFGIVISHNPGETEDTMIADLAVAVHAGQIKIGSPTQAGHTCTYNQLLRIEETLGEIAEFSGTEAFREKI